MTEVAEGIRNSKKVCENEQAVSKTISTDLTAERVTKKWVLKTTFWVEIALKKKLKETNCSSQEVKGIHPRHSRNLNNNC